MRRIVNGKKVKVGQTEEETTPPEGQVQTSRLNDVQFGKLGEESTDQVKESFDYHTNSPEWQEAINRDAALTTEQGTEKFDNADPKVQAIRDRIAARKHKKKLAAEKKKKNKKKANDIIMDMNILKLDLMKGKGYSKTNTQRFHPDLPDNHPYNFDETTRNHNYKGLKIHGDKEDKKRAFKRIDDDIEAGKVKEIESATLNASKLIKSDSAETIFKATSLKLDLMKDGIQGGGKNIPMYPRSVRSERASDYGSQHKEGQAERERSEYDRESIVGYGGETSDNPSGRPYAKGKRPVKGVNSKPDSRIDPEDYTHDEKDETGSTGDASSYNADSFDQRFPAVSSGTNSTGMKRWDKEMGERRQRGTEHDRKWIEPKTLDSKDRGTTLPKGLKEKSEETIYKAISLKLDLMKGKFDKQDKKISLDDINEDDTFEEKQRKLHDLANYQCEVFYF